MASKRTPKRTATDALLGDVIARCDTLAANRSAGKLVQKNAEVAESAQQQSLLAQRDLDQAAALLSGTYLPPSTLEQEMSDKIASLEKKLADETAKNAELVDKLAKYIADVAAASARAAAAESELSKLQIENADLASKLDVNTAELNALTALSASAPTMVSSPEIDQAEEAFVQLKAAAALANASQQSSKSNGQRYWRSAQHPGSLNGYSGWN